MRRVVFNVLVACLGALLFTFFPEIAAAQPRPVLVLPVAIGDGETAAALAARADLVAGAMSGDARPLTSQEATQRFEEHGSMEPPSVTDNDIERWLTLSRQAVRHLARTDYAAARETLLEAQRLSEGAAAELDRELTRARQVLDTCLYDVRAYIETNDPRAESRALECRRLVPRIAPSPYNHTPEVVELLQRIDRRLAESPPGNLLIDSSPSDCAVRLNGVEFGHTPFVSEELAPGEYRAQVECDAVRRGRVHRIRVAEGGQTRVQIDVRFDTAVHTETTLRLQYAREEEANAFAGPDARAIAGLIGAQEVWLLRSTDGGAGVQITRLDVAAGRSTASVRGPSESIPALVNAAIAGQFDGTTSTPIGESSAQTSSGGRSTFDIVMGTTIGVLGVAALGASWGLYSWRVEGGTAVGQVDEAHPLYLARQQDWLDRQGILYGVALGGSALVITALPFVMSDEEGVPWWSWVIGGVGVAVAAVGVVELAIANPCPDGARVSFDCVDRAAGTDRGVLWLSMAAPLIAVPVIYGIRSALGVSATARVEASGNGAILRVAGEF